MSKDSTENFNRIRQSTCVWRPLKDICYSVSDSVKFQLVLQHIPVDALLPVLGSHHQGSVINFFVRFSIYMTIGRYIRHYLEISLMFLYPLNLAISGNKVSLFQWSLSYVFVSSVLKNSEKLAVVSTQLTCVTTRDTALPN